LTKIIIPGQNVPITDGGDPINPTWYEKLKFLEKLQPLSDIVFPPPVDISGKSNITRTINTQSGTSYTFQLTDAGNAVDFTSGSAVSATVPANATIAFPVGTQIDVMQAGAGKVTLVAAGSVTIQSISGNKAIAAQYVGVTLLKVGTDVWRLMGSLIP
jgi:hypothetical protein